MAGPGTRSVSEGAVFDYRYENVYEQDGQAKRALCSVVESNLSFSIPRDGLTNCQPQQILLDRGCKFAVAQLPL
jgi:hypothetical protein